MKRTLFVAVLGIIIAALVALAAVMIVTAPTRSPLAMKSAPVVKVDAAHASMTQHAATDRVSGVRVFASAARGVSRRAPAHYVYISIYVMLTNTSAKAVHISPFDFRLRDDDSHTPYPLHPIGAAGRGRGHAGAIPAYGGDTRPLKESVLQVGRNIAGDVTFVVPAHAQRYTLLWWPYVEARALTVPMTMRHINAQ